MNTIIKYATVALFAVLLYFLLNYIIAQLANAINLGELAPTVRYYICKLGIFQAVNIYVSLLIASWFTNKLLAYVSG